MKKIVLALFLIVILTAPGLAADLPKLISFQGELTDGSGRVVTGTPAIEFKIYDVATGGAAIWTENHGAVTVTDGVFNVELGSVTPLTLPFDTGYWVSINVAGDGEMLPRHKLLTVPYAYYATNADTAFILADGAITYGELTVADTMSVGDTLTLLTASAASEGLIVQRSSTPDNQLQLRTATMTMQRANASNANLEIGTSNTGAWGVNGGNIWLEPDGLSNFMVIKRNGTVGIGAGVNPADSLTISNGGVSISDTLQVGGKIQTNDTVAAAYFSGDGRGLSNINTWAWVQINDTGTIGVAETNFGEGSAENTDTGGYGISWNGFLNRFDVSVSGIYEVRLDARIEYPNNANEFIYLDVKVNGASQLDNIHCNYQYVTLVGFNVGIRQLPATLTWVGQVNAGQNITVTIDTPHGTNTGFLTRSAIMVKRLASN